MNAKQKPLGPRPPASPARKGGKLVALKDLVPKQDLRAGHRVVFGHVQRDTKLDTN